MKRIALPLILHRFLRVFACRGCRHARSTALCVLLLLVAAGPRAQAQPSTPSVPDITQPAGPPATLAPRRVPGTGDGPVRRAGFLRIDAPVLNRTVSTFEAGGRQQVAFRLFDDVRLVARFDAAGSVPGETGGMTGTVEGAAFSNVLMVVRGGRITANIHVPGAVYRIRPAENGLHRVIEVDPSAYDDHGDQIPGSRDGERPVRPAGPEEAPPDGEDVRTWDLMQSMMPSAPAAAAAGPILGNGPIIDVYVFYTDDARVGAGGIDNIQDEIALAVLGTNQAYYDSGVNQRIRLAGMSEVWYTESLSARTDLTRLETARDGFLDDVFTIRDRYKADIVSLWTEQLGDRECGLGNVMMTVSSTFERRAFHVVKRECATDQFSFAHELGHNMGLLHDWFKDSGTKPYDYAHGYLDIADGWRTIMAYADAADCSDEVSPCPAPSQRKTPGAPASQRIGRFSNPNRYFNGRPTGSTSSTRPANAAKALNNTAATVAAFRKGATIGSAAGAGDQFGNVLAAGDFNGDGLEDLAVGTPLRDLRAPNGTVQITNYGEVNIVYGSWNGLTAHSSLTLTHPDKGNFRFGGALAVGDFNGDTYDDLAVGVPGYDSGALTDAGAVVVYYGSGVGLRPLDRQFLMQGYKGFVQTAASGDEFGYALAAGDFNGDGYDDLAVGVPGEDAGAQNAGAINVIHGGSDGLVPSTSRHWTENVAGNVARQDDRFGSVLAVGAFNEHRFSSPLAEDLAVGIPFKDTNGGVNSGAVMIFSGSYPTGLMASPNAYRYLRQGPAIGVEAVEAGDMFGFSLAAGDFNQDYYTDLAVGVPFEDINGIENAGVVHVFYSEGTNGVTGNLSQLWMQPVKNGEQPEKDDYFGWALAAGNFDNQRGLDLAVGAPFDRVGVTQYAGVMNVFYSGATPSRYLSATGSQLWVQESNGVNGVSQTGDYFGNALAVGYVRSPGVPSLAVGVPMKDAGGQVNAGAVYVLHGTVNGGLTGAGSQFLFHGAPLGTLASGASPMVVEGVPALDAGQDASFDPAPKAMADVADVPASFTLHGNYPNPFNPSTTIRFDLPEAADVKVEVVDLLGRVVLQLEQPGVSAGTNRSVQIDASALASGTYLYRLTARSAGQQWSRTGRMALLK